MPEKQPKVSLGIPVYNAEKYLAATLDTILAQTFTDFELIISDNASTDGTEEICRFYVDRDARIRYHRHEQNLGAARNFNVLVELACGEYFKWIAYDDPLSPTCLEKCVDALDASPDVIMSYARTILIDENDELIEYHDDRFNLRSPRAHQRFRQYFHSSAWCHPVFGLVRTDVLKRTGMIGAYASSDKVLLGEFALQGQCVEVPEYLAYRRLHPENSTSANTTDEAMAAWFDPASARRVMAPRWRRLLELHHGIQRAPLNFVEKTQCYAELGWFYLSPGRVIGAFKDFRQMLRRMWRGVVPQKS